MKHILGEGWWKMLSSEFDKEYMQNIGRLLTIHKDEVYPKGGLEAIFRAYTLCPYENVKVVILGQDPYHDGSADGLCFSTTRRIPPSLRIIFKALEKDFGIKRTNTDLSDWAKQGVLMLNTSLTVFPGKPNSCVNWNWLQFINATLEILDFVYVMAWGKYAIDIASKHKALMMIDTCHPAATIYNPSLVFEPKFAELNKELVEPIKWV